MENVKTLILNNKKDSSFKGILNLKEKEKSLIKLYNIPNSSKNLALGIKQKDEVVKIPLSLKNNNSEFILPKNISLSEKFFCAVVDVTNAFCPEIVLSGSINNSSQNEKIESSFIVSKPDDISVLYEEDDENQIENLVDKNLEEDLNSVYFDACAKCKYKKVFYDEGEKCCSFSKNINKEDLSKSCFCVENKIKNGNETMQSSACLSEKNNLLNNNLTKSEEDIEINKNGKKEQISGFYEQIKNQIELLFEKYEREEVLEKIVSNSQWVKVKYDETSSFYVIGLIFNEEKNKVEYIAYGLPSKNKDVPPDDLKEFSQWLPTNIFNQEEEGYWVVYQEAEKGETIKVDFVN